MWNPDTLQAYERLVGAMVARPDVQAMADMKQHAKGVSCLDHSLFVSYLSFSLCRRWHWNDKAAARAGLLHDLFLSTREENGMGLWKHLRLHPQMALENAKAFGLSEVEEDIILKHMWPVTISKPPRYRESMVVNMADKICTVCEVLRLYQLFGVRKRLGHFNYSYCEKAPHAA